METQKRLELDSFSKEDLEEMAKSFAKMRIIGNVFHGSIDKQEVRYQNDRMEIITEVTEIKSPSRYR